MDGYIWMYIYGWIYATKVFGVHLFTEQLYHTLPLPVSSRMKAAVLHGEIWQRGVTLLSVLRLLGFVGY